MPIHADVVLATHTQPPAGAPRPDADITEEPAPIDGANGVADQAPPTTTPRSGKKEKKL